MQPGPDGSNYAPLSHARAQVPLTVQCSTLVVELPDVAVAHRHGHRTGYLGHLDACDRAVLIVVRGGHQGDVTLHPPPPHARPQHEDWHGAAEPHGHPHVVHDHLQRAHEVGAVTVVGPSAWGEHRRAAPPPHFWRCCSASQVLCACLKWSLAHVPC